MASRLDEFKDFVRMHPLLKNEVNSKKKTWQDIYEDYVVMPNDPIWDKYKLVENEEVVKDKASKSGSTEDIVKNVLGYVKKINPDTITKYVSSIQKIMELLASFGAGGAVSAISSKNKKTGDPLFDKRFDEWY